MKKFLILIVGVVLGGILTVAILWALDIYKVGESKSTYSAYDIESVVAEDYDDEPVTEVYGEGDYDDYVDGYEDLETIYSEVYLGNNDNEYYDDKAQYILRQDSTAYWALDFFKNTAPALSSFWFWDEYDFQFHPRSTELTENGKISKFYPFAERRLEPPADVSRAYVVYKDALEMLSAHRRQIDFYELYQKFRKEIHIVIDKETYDQKYKGFVTRLLIAYDDIDTEDKYHQIDAVMFSHFNSNHYWNMEPRDYTTDLAFYIDDFDLIISENAKTKMRNLPDSMHIKEEYKSDFAMVWVYSFWNRRDKEHKKREIYNLLRLIEDDYAHM